jgi:hypothetical protein
MALGNPKLMGGADHVLLERTDTNKVTAGANQSELRIAWLNYHDYLVAHDNILDDKGYGLNDHKAHYRETKDPQSGAMVRTYVQIDYWTWMIRCYDEKVITHQLTLWGFSREQFMRHAVSMSSLSGQESEGGGLWAQLTKR